MENDSYLKGMIRPPASMSRAEEAIRVPRIILADANNDDAGLMLKLYRTLENMRNTIKNAKTHCN